MSDQIDALRDQFKKEISLAAVSADFEELKVRYLGKKGPIQQLMRSLKDVSNEERPLVGKAINDLKEEITNHLEQKLETCILQEENSRLESEKIDIALPGKRKFSGRKHLITQTMEHMIEILGQMGFTVSLGPDVETDYYNFEALNFSAEHPARDMQDTFYITKNMLLRTHTSNVQVRVMETQKPPIRVIAPGKVYRNETITARSHVFFHQIEGFYIDKDVSFKDLLGTLDEFLSKVFEKKVETRCRPSYFPFVEPGMEVDIKCLTCSRSGCQLCKYSGWLEVLGAGMIHPEVLRYGDIDPEVYSGYAWGLGVERIILLKHGIRDIRTFTQNDMRFLEQFAGV